MLKNTLAMLSSKLLLQQALRIQLQTKWLGRFAPASLQLKGFTACGFICRKCSATLLAIRRLLNPSPLLRLLSKP